MTRAPEEPEVAPPRRLVLPPQLLLVGQTSSTLPDLSQAVDLIPQGAPWTTVGERKCGIGDIVSCPVDVTQWTGSVCLASAITTVASERVRPNNYDDAVHLLVRDLLQELIGTLVAGSENNLKNNG